MATEQKQVIHSVSTGAVFKVAAILVLFWALYMIRDLLMVVLVAVVIASAIEPGTRWLMRRRFPRVVAVMSIYLFLAAGLSLLFYFLILPLVQETASLARALPAYLQSANVWVPGGAGEALPAGFSLQGVASQLNETIANFSGGFLTTISAVFGGALSFLLILVLSFYLSVQERGIAKFLTMITPLRYRKYVLSLWDRSEAKIGRWMQGQLLLAAIVFVLVYLGLQAFGLFGVGIEHALLLAALAGVFEIIPMFGPVLAAIPAVIIAFLSGGVSIALLVVLLYILIQQLENHVIYPLVVRKMIDLPPIISILAIIAGGQLFGFLGVIVSVPVAAVLMEYFDDLQRERKIEEEKLGNNKDE